MAVSCVSTMFASFAAGSYGPAVEQLTDEFKVSSVAAYIGITMFTAGFAVGPMPLSPFSEIKGRKPVFVGTAALFLVCQVCTAVTRSYPGYVYVKLYSRRLRFLTFSISLLVARFFAGVGGSTFSTMVGGIVADMFGAETRNIPMSLFAGFSLFGIGLGPLTCGFIAQHTTWRWIFYMQSIIAAILLGSVILFFPETRGLVILQREAYLLNIYQEDLERREHAMESPDESEQMAEGEEENVVDSKPHRTQRVRWKARSDEDGSENITIGQLIVLSLVRPFKFLITEPVVFFFSLWMAFSWAVLYISISAIPMVFETQYGFSLSQSNAVLTSLCVGCIVATVLAIVQDRVAESRPGWNSVPEHRLYFSCVESFFLPIGLFVIGWTSEERVHWIVPAVFIAITAMGIFSIYLAVFNYFADIYQTYASSTIAAQSFCRNMLGGAFPLVSRQLFHNLGYGPAGTLLGGIATLLTLVPWVLVFFGPTIRGKSRLTAGKQFRKGLEEQAKV